MATKTDKFMVANQSHMMTGGLYLHWGIFWSRFGKSPNGRHLHTDLKFDIEINVEWLKEYAHEIEVVFSSFSMYDFCCWTIELTIYTKITLILPDVSDAIFTHVIHFDKVRGFQPTSNITLVFFPILKQFYFCERLNVFFQVGFLFFCFFLFFATLCNCLFHLVCQQSNYSLNIYHDVMSHLKARTFSVSGTFDLFDRHFDGQNMCASYFVLRNWYNVNVTLVQMARDQGSIPRWGTDFLQIANHNLFYSLLHLVANVISEL